MWNTIPDYPNYEINKKGEIRNKTSGLIKKHYIGTDGYPTVELYRNNTRKHFKIHRLLAIIFIPNPENKREVNHINLNKLDFSLENLEWVTPSENMQHIIKNETSESPRVKAAKENVKKATKANMKKIEQFNLSGISIATYESVSEASRQTGIRRTSISEVVNGKRKSAGDFIWKFIE